MEEMLSIEVWDTGIGIPEGELQSIFEEYRQLDNAARERKRGLGLGLSIVQRLGNLLGHRVSVRSRPGKGSVFAIEVELQTAEAKQRPESPARDGQAKDGDDGSAGGCPADRNDPGRRGRSRTAGVAGAHP